MGVAGKSCLGLEAKQIQTWFILYLKEDHKESQSQVVLHATIPEKNSGKPLQDNYMDLLEKSKDKLEVRKKLTQYQVENFRSLGKVGVSRSIKLQRSSSYPDQPSNNCSAVQTERQVLIVHICSLLCQYSNLVGNS